MGPLSAVSRSCRVAGVANARCGTCDGSICFRGLVGVRVIAESLMMGGFEQGGFECDIWNGILGELDIRRVGHL